MFQRKDVSPHFTRTATLLALPLLLGFVFHMLLEHLGVHESHLNQRWWPSIHADLPFVLFLLAGVLWVAWGLALSARERAVLIQGLRERKELLRTLLDALPDMILFKDGAGRWVRVNDAVLEFFCLGREELLGHTSRELAERHPAFRELFLACDRSDEAAWAAGRVSHFEETFPGIGGAGRVMEFTKVPLFHEDGRRKGLVEIGRDVTARHEAETERQRAFEMLGTVFDSMEAVVYVSDPENHTLLMTNRTAREAVAKVGVKGLRRCWELFSSCGAPCWECSLRGLKTLEVGVTLTREYHCPVDGRWYQIRQQLIPWLNGRMAHLGVAVDVGALKAAEEALRESRERLVQASSLAQVGYWEWWVNEGRSRWSPEMYRSFGMTVPTTDEAEVMYVTQEDFEARVHPDDLAMVARAMEAFRTSGHFEMEYRIRWPNGQVRHAHVVGDMVFDQHGRPARAFGVFQDVTERYVLEALTQARREEVEHAGRLSLMGEMVTGLSHELSQPLGAIRNYLDGCLMRLEDGHADREALRSGLEKAYSQAERAGAVIHRIREFARKREPVREPHDIPLLVSEALSFMEHELAHARVAVDLLTEEVEAACVDKVEFQQVLVNLLKNAIDAMTDQPVRKVRVAVVREAGAVVVSVTDTGRGLDGRAADSLFEPFSSSKSGNLGLGLPICRSIVESWGGRILAVPGAGKGMVFYFSIPLNEEARHE